MVAELTNRIRESLRTVPDFPKEGILFYDITTLLADGPLFSELIDTWAKHLEDLKVDRIAGLESRGFIFGCPLATALKKPFIPIRKPGKLPYKVNSVTFDTEYSSDGFEIHKDAISSGDRVAIIDDLLATGGTAAAAIKLIELCKGEVVQVGCLLELTELNGRDKLPRELVHSWVEI